MQSSYPTGGKTIIRCSSCLSKLRVPVDKGRISVTCPTCRKEFFYNPNSVPHTLKQIALSGAAFVKGGRRNKLIALGAAAVVIIALIFLIISLQQKPKVLPEKGPARTVINQSSQTVMQAMLIDNMVNL